jgi:hypothetical protein
LPPATLTVTSAFSLIGRSSSPLTLIPLTDQFPVA